jgi:hypothetical protein
MSAGNTPENFVHNQTVTKVEGVRQAAVAGATQSAAKTAEIAFYRSVITSCRVNNNYAGIQPAMQALRELGVTGQ